MLFLRYLAIFLGITFAAYSGDVPRKLAFTRDGAIYVANFDGTAPKRIASGAWPRISPDGARVAFNTDGERGPKRHIVIADVATGETTVLSNIPNDNSFGPVWSPDGSKLIFNTLVKHDWRLAFINADGSDFRYFEPKAKVAGLGLFSVAWAPSGESFYAQDLDVLYHLALDGTVKDQHAVEQLISKGSFSSGQQFSVSADGRTLLVDAEMDDSTSGKDEVGRSTTVWMIDLSTWKSTRLTPKGFGGWSPAWVSDSEFVCNTQPKKAKQPFIYRLSVDGKKREPLVKNAQNPSVSR